jgi:phage tail sheath gpL-like
VYSSFDASSVVYGGGSGQTVGAVGCAVTGTVGEATTFTSAAQAETAYGSSTTGIGLAELVRIALKNGASAVVAVPVALGTSGDTAAYTSALAVLAAEEDISVVICDSGDAAVHSAVKTHVEDCAAARKERIGVVAPKSGETVSQLVERAKSLNSERMLLVAPCSTDSEGAALANGALAAAAVAGALAGDADPALPLGGAELSGLSDLETDYSDGDIDLLVQGGVTPLETVGGTVSVVRGITTRTTTGGAADTTWRESTTIRIVDDVIPAVRDALRAKFLRTKNTVQNRSAIASQVVITLEDKLSRQIIDSYDSVSVTADSEDPTRCLVDFNFAVAHGLNQIYISAHITV